MSRVPAHGAYADARSDERDIFDNYPRLILKAAGTARMDELLDADIGDLPVYLR